MPFDDEYAQKSDLVNVICVSLFNAGLLDVLQS